MVESGAQPGIPQVMEEDEQENDQQDHPEPVIN